MFPIRTIVYRLQLCIVSCLTHTCLPSYCLSFYDYVYLMDMCGTTNKCIHGREYSYTCINNNRMVLKDSSVRKNKIIAKVWTKRFDGKSWI